MLKVVEAATRKVLFAVDAWSANCMEDAKAFTEENNWFVIRKEITFMGDMIWTGSPSIDTLPWNPPVEWITGMPKRTFISVDLPAPFSPSSAWISPGRTFSETSLRTVLESYVFVI